jgi:hypothetical protein
MDAFTKFTADGDLDPEEGVRLFLEELFGPMKRVRVGENADGQLQVQVDEVDPPADVDMDGDVEARLQGLGLDTRLIQATAGAGNAADYAVLKAKLKGRN